MSAPEDISGRSWNWYLANRERLDRERQERLAKSEWYQAAKRDYFQRVRLEEAENESDGALMSATPDEIARGVIARASQPPAYEACDVCGGREWFVWWWQPVRQDCRRLLQADCARCWRKNGAGWRRLSEGPE